VVNESNLPQNDIWIWDLTRETEIRMRLGNNGGDSPAWTNDSQRIAYHPSVTPVIDWQSISGVSPPERLVTGYPGALDPWHPAEFTRDGRSLVFEGRERAAFEMDIGIISLAGEIETSWLISGKNTQRQPELSPDNRWIAYQSNESGRNEIYVHPFPNVSDNRWIVSNQGGSQPIWSPNGSELYFLQPGATPHLMSAKIDTSGEGFSVDGISNVMRWPYFNSQFTRSYDISPDGKRFLALKDVQSGTPKPRIIVVQNWFDELAQKMHESK
jgi:Tol biopolymer transport system component